MLPTFFSLVSTILISTTHLKITASHKTNEEVTWPEGTYGLPRPKSGCPKTDQFFWDQGWRLQNLENDGSEYSQHFHMEAFLTRELLSRAFCIKWQDHEIIGIKRPWPEGSYCIYQYGVECPPGMVNGSIKWNDNNDHHQGNLNQALGALPRGDYGYDTKIFYCCQNQTTSYHVIELPITSPFYLLPYKSRSCQRVKWATSTLEHIKYGTKYNNFNGYGHHVYTDENQLRPTVYYCYYESCKHKLKETQGIFNSSQHSLVAYFPSYQSCSWLITVQESFVVSLNLTSLYIADSKENVLTIYDGASEESPRIKTYCGSVETPNNVEVFSSGRNIYIVLKSGNLSQHTNFNFGFKGRYGPTKIFSTPRRTPHNVEAIALTFSALLLIFVGVAVVIGYRRTKIGMKKKKPTSRFHVPSTISLETTDAVKLSERAPSCKETRNPYYVTARLWDDSSLSRSSDNVAYVTSPELNHGYMDAPGADHTA